MGLRMRLWPVEALMGRILPGMLKRLTGCRNLGSTCWSLGSHGLPTQVLHLATGGHDVSPFLVVFLQFHKIGNVQEGNPLQADVDECRPHAREAPGSTALCDCPRQGGFTF